jgi:hypothetical protein
MAEVTSTATSIDRLLACTAVSWCADRERHQRELSVPRSSLWWCLHRYGQPPADREMTSEAPAKQPANVNGPSSTDGWTRLVLAVMLTALGAER